MQLTPHLMRTNEHRVRSPERDCSFGEEEGAVRSVLLVCISSSSDTWELDVWGVSAGKGWGMDVGVGGLLVGNYRAD